MNKFGASLILLIICVIVIYVYYCEMYNNSRYQYYINIENREDLKPEFKLEEGDIFDLGPCKNGLINDNGTCKTVYGDNCLISSQCSTSNICFSGICTVKPESWNEKVTTAFDGSQLCINKHLLRLEDNKFIPPMSWWEINKIASITEDEEMGFFLILSEDGDIFRTIADDIITNFNTYTGSINYKKIINIENNMIILTHSGNLLLLDKDFKKTKKITDIKGINLNLFIHDIYTVKDRSLIIKYEETTIIILKNMDNFLFFDNSPNYQVIFGNDINHRILIYNNEIRVYINRIKSKNIKSGKFDIKQGNPIIIKGRYNYATFDKDKQDTVYLMNNKGSIFYFKIRKRKRSKLIDTNVKSIGYKIINSNNNIWALTISKCLNV